MRPGAPLSFIIRMKYYIMNLIFSAQQAFITQPLEIIYYIAPKWPLKNNHSTAQNWQFTSNCPKEVFSRAFKRF